VYIVKKIVFHFLTAFLFFTAANAQNTITSKTIDYKQGKTKLEGYLALPGNLNAKTPAVIVVHDWMGVGDYVKMRADQLAALGYIAFAADIYGKETRPKDQAEAGEFATKYKSDRKLMRQRIQAALDVIKKQKNVDGKKIAVMGYCFGGTVALELSRSGAPVLGAISFHGGLSTPNPKDAKNIKGKILALHGADDPFVPADEFKAFVEEMRANKVDWQMIEYGGAVHSFTHPQAGNDNSKGAAYNEKADKRSWVAMQNFLSEIFDVKDVK
jgi:dienelactone hydrolase